MELEEQKKLKDLVDDFMADLRERRNKINERINELAGQLADIQSKINETMKKLMTAEIAGDEGAKTKLIKNIHDLQLEKERIKGLKKVYEVDAAKTGYDEKKIETIKAQAIKAKTERQDTYQNMIARKKELQEKIKELERELDELDKEMSTFNLTTEADAVGAVVNALIPQTQSLPHFKKKAFYNAWIDDNDAEMQNILSKLEPKEEPKFSYQGPVVTRHWE